MKAYVLFPKRKKNLKPKMKKMYICSNFGELAITRYLFCIAFFVIDPYNVNEKSFDFYASMIRKNAMFKSA